MEIKLYLRMLQRGWWIIAVTIFMAVNVALIFDYLSTPIYSSSARFTVSPSPTIFTSGQETLNSMDVLDKRSITQTFAEFLNSPQVYKETLLSMNLVPTDMLNYKHSTVVIPTSNVLEVTIEGPDAKLVASLANNIGQNAIQKIKQLYKIYDINMLDPALVPIIPIRPQPLLDAGVAALLGLVIGAALAITWEQILVPLEAYRQQASLDPVSLVLNRRYLENRLFELIAHKSPEGISIGLVRLNGLQDLIDTLPQSVVQKLMRQVAGVLRKELRGNDMIGRWNDTTFILVLPATSEAAAGRTMDRIRVSLLKPVNLVNYGETFKLDPLTSVASYQEDDTPASVTQRAQDTLEHVYTTEESNAQSFS